MTAEFTLLSFSMRVHEIVRLSQSRVIADVITPSTRVQCSVSFLRSSDVILHKVGFVCIIRGQYQITSDTSYVVAVFPLPSILNIP